MDGFFITVNCSPILFDSSETSYKIFIDNTKMSIVYELKEWIRFMFNLKSCFFLIHDNSVIHELEDIKALEILKHLQTRPCTRLDCIHKRIEKNLLNKLNLFTYWNEVKVHKLFAARQNSLTQKVSHNLQYCSNGNEKSNTFSMESHQNNFVQLNKSKLANTEHVISSPSECICNKENSTEKNQLVLEEINTSVSDKNFNLEKIKTSRTFSNHKQSTPPHSESNGNVSLCTGSIGLTSSENKSPKIHSVSKVDCTKRKTPRCEIPFSLGALLCDIREKAQSNELKQKEDTDNKEASFCLYGENDKNTSAEMNSTDNINDSAKRRKRRRKHKKENMKVDIKPSFPDKSWNNEEPMFNTKPNHIRFSDADEVMETEATDTFDTRSDDCNSFKDLNNETQTNIVELGPQPTPLTEEDEDKKDCSLRVRDHVKAFQMFNEVNCDRETDVAVEKKEVDSSLQNFSPLESLKQRIKVNGIISKFY